MMEIDLNALGQLLYDNSQEVILNPAQPPHGNFLELNDLLEGNNVVEEAMLEQNIPVLVLEEQALMDLSDEEMQHHVPPLPMVPVNMLDEEIPLD